MKLSEHFYSVQGEGITAGMPAYFIRFGMCNLMCGGSKGLLVREKKATWWCDSEAIWRNSLEVSYDELIQSFIEIDKLQDILNGDINIVWTGGEPTIDQNISEIIGFTEYIKAKYNHSNLFTELETNGTLLTPQYRDFVYEHISQINCSPKLSNSGMPENIRIVPDSLNFIKEHPNSWFKFVISTEKDLKEAEETFIIPFNISKKRVIIMPGVDNREDLAERTRFLYEMTKRTGYRGVTRQHILAWDKKTGV